MSRKGESFLGSNLTTAALIFCCLRVRVATALESRLGGALSVSWRDSLPISTFKSLFMLRAFVFFVDDEGKPEPLGDGCGQRARHLTRAATRGHGKIRYALMSFSLLTTSARRTAMQRGAACPTRGAAHFSGQISIRMNGQARHFARKGKVFRSLRTLSLTPTCPNSPRPLTSHLYLFFLRLWHKAIRLPLTMYPWTHRK